jgi:hypothetical protein
MSYIIQPDKGLIRSLNSDAFFAEKQKQVSQQIVNSLNQFIGVIHFMNQGQLFSVKKMITKQVLENKLDSVFANFMLEEIGKRLALLDNEYY